MKLFVCVALMWVALGLVAAGGFRADLTARFPNQSGIECRRDAGFSLVFGVMGGPISIVVASAVTGFFAAGWESPFTASFWNCGTS